MDSDELSKSRGIVVPDSLSIAPSLQHRVSLNNFVLEGGLTLLPLARGADGGKVRDDLLCVLSLASTRLATEK